MGAADGCGQPTDLAPLAEAWDDGRVGLYAGDNSSVS